MDKYLIEACNKFLSEDEGPSDMDMGRVEEYTKKFNDLAKGKLNSMLFSYIEEMAKGDRYSFMDASGGQSYDSFDEIEARIISNSIVLWLEENLGDVITGYTEPGEESFAIFDEMIEGVENNEYGDVGEMIEIGDDIFGGEDLDLMIANSTPANFKKVLIELNPKMGQVF